jgi:hypothetical protein
MMTTASSAVRFLFATGLAIGCSAHACVGTAEDGRGTRADGPGRGVPRRSHLQPVGEMVAPRTADDLGLRLVRASAVLRQQLALERGCGLVVEGVTRDSIAMQAGFEEHDVLVMLDDQLLLLPEQFNARHEATPAAATVQCRLLRGGRRLVITLGGTGPSPVAGAEPSRNHLRPTASALAILPRTPGVDRVERQPAVLRAGAETDETLVRKDADFSIRLIRGDETRLVVTDPAGRLVFSDAIDTPEARSRMPVAIRGRVEAMERVLERSAPGVVQPVVEIGRLDVEPVEIR